jgi:hypothetical protein
MGQFAFVKSSYQKLHPTNFLEKNTSLKHTLVGSRIQVPKNRFLAV